MKKNIHPKYFDKAKIKCACGAEFSVGSTVEETNVEICSNCHPYFTGKEKLVDTAGRVDKFRERMKVAEAHKKSKKETKSKNEVQNGSTEEKTEVKDK